METEIRSQLLENLDEAEWEWLIPHAEREVVIVVTQGLDLLAVGEAIANDQVSSVQHWITEQLIFKPSPEQKKRWNENSKKRFNALIVQPFILIQELETCQQSTEETVDG